MRVAVSLLLAFAFAVPATAQAAPVYPSCPASVGGYKLTSVSQRGDESYPQIVCWYNEGSGHPYEFNAGWLSHVAKDDQANIGCGVAPNDPRRIDSATHKAYVLWNYPLREMPPGFEAAGKALLAELESTYAKRCPSVGQPPPPPAPPPAPGQGTGDLTEDDVRQIKGGKLKLEWSMPDRYGLDGDGDGIIDAMNLPAKIAPSRWAVDLRIPSCPNGTYRMTTSRARPVRAESLGDCRFRLFFAENRRRYPLTVRATTLLGGEFVGRTEIRVRDHLVFGLGDSNGSGEGNPDKPMPGLAWQDERCHRSAHAYQSQAALGLEQASTRSSVTFVHLACSGASVTEGMIGGYPGIVETGGADLAPQVEALRRLRRHRDVDAVVLSIGVNDLRFSDIVQFCLLTSDCPTAPYPAGGVKTLQASVADNLTTLDARYKALSKTLRRALGPRAATTTIFISEYFDSTRGTDGQPCDPLLGTFPVAFDREEAEWASTYVLTNLNLAVRRAARKYGWRVVGGIQSAFVPHGYCSSDPWVRQLSESMAIQDNEAGALHANVTGHSVMANLLRPMLERAVGK